jgi:hypothetical protein
MPKDEWQKARDKDVGKRAKVEYAATGGKSTFPRSGSDDIAPPPIAGDSQTKAKKPNRMRKSPHCGKEIVLAKFGKHKKACKRARLRKLSAIYRQKYRPKGKKVARKGGRETGSAMTK